MTSREESIPGAGMQGYTEVDKKEDVKVLHGMGYAQELERRLSRFSNFASFLLDHLHPVGRHQLARPGDLRRRRHRHRHRLAGRLLRQSLVFAVAMAQISSAYPTAGGLYHWGSILGNRGTGWVTAWLNLLGLITVLGAINVGTWTFFVGAFGPALGIENNLTNQTIFLIIITGAQALINHLGIRLTAMLTDFSGWLIFGGSILIAIVCLIAAEHWDFSRLFTFKNYSGDAGRQASGRRSPTVGLPARPVAADLHHHRLRRFGAYVRGDAEGGAIRCRARW